MQAIEIREMCVIYITLPSLAEKKWSRPGTTDVRDEILNTAVLLPSNDNH